MTATLVERGWARFPGALSTTVVDDLVRSHRVEWHPLPAREGVVHQQGFGANEAVAIAARPVRVLGEVLGASLTRAAAVTALPSVPEANEVTWTRYPPRRGHITAHRDPDA